MERSDDGAIPPDLKPSLEIRALHHLIGRYWNVTVPADSMVSGANMPIILYLHERRAADVFQYDIERAFSITRSTASRVLGLMEKKGLVTRSAVAWDARVRKIELTQRATAIVEDIDRKAATLERTLFKDFSDDEQRLVMRDLARMKDNLIATGLVGADKGPDDGRAERSKGRDGAERNEQCMQAQEEQEERR